VFDVLEVLNRDWDQVTSPPSAVLSEKPGRRRTLLVEVDANERELLAGIPGRTGCEGETAAWDRHGFRLQSRQSLPTIVACA
jgi:hypothetical protein